MTKPRSASAIDPDLGFVILSAFDTEENLRRAIPLQVIEFIPKPLPERAGFEARLPGWIDRTRARRRERVLARQADTVSADLEAARLERDIEAVASDSTRDVLTQTSAFLSVIHAHLVSATLQLGQKTRHDPSLSLLLHNLEQARQSADAAITAADRFFEVAYSRRDDSPAMLAECLPHAANVARRTPTALDRDLRLDLAPNELSLPVAGLTSIELLLLLVPLLRAALALAPAHSAVLVSVQTLSRLDQVWREPHYRHFSWFNRRHAHVTRPGYAIQVSPPPAADRSAVSAWLSGSPTVLGGISNQGLITGLQACHGCLGFPSAENLEHSQIVLVLPGGLT
jgi:hypothetical protein